jgi:23S rRNA (guanosine2251-2'-O)-methyltransferase
MSQPSRSARGVSHNRQWLWGRHAVMETLRAGTWIPMELAISPRCPTEIAHEVRHWSTQHHVPCIEESDAALTKRCRSEEHQGMAARLPEFPYANFASLLASIEQYPVWLILDRIHDSHNFGAMVRSACGLGVSAVLVGEKEQSPVNRQVVQSSAGAINLLPIARAPALLMAVEQLKQRGVAIIAASEKATHDIFAVKLHSPLAIIIGNEGRGVDPALIAQCDELVRIQMAHRLGSLNAAVAAGIVCYEVLRQRHV